MIIRKINDIELLESDRISALSFNWALDAGDKTPEAYAEEHKPNGKWGAFTDEGELMACLCVPSYRVHFDGHLERMAGIGGVCTYPHHRRKGAVKGMLRRVLDELYDEKTPFSYLYPFSDPFYAHYGYQNTCGSIEWTFDLSAIPNSPYDGTFELYRPGAPIDDYDAAYQCFAAKWNMMVQRSVESGHSVQHADPFKRNVSAFLYRNASGAPAGYVVFEHRVDPERGPMLAGSELVFDGYGSLKAIMSFIRSYISSHQFFTISMPETMNLDSFCVDFALSRTTKRMKKNGMVRVVHVGSVLQSARYIGDGQLSIYIHDSFLAQNNGLYQIAFQDGAAQIVQFTKKPPSPFGQPCDIEVTVNVFSAAILGAYDVADFEYMDGVAIHTDPVVARQVFYKKPCWISNYF